MTEEKNNEAKKSVEENFAELDKLLQEMDEGKASLEDTFASYQKGLGLVKELGDAIDSIEKQLLMLENVGEAEES